MSADRMTNALDWADSLLTPGVEMRLEKDGKRIIAESNGVIMGSWDTWIVVVETRGRRRVKTFVRRSQVVKHLGAKVEEMGMLDELEAWCADARWGPRSPYRAGIA